VNVRITVLACYYLILAAIVCIFVARQLDEKRKVRLPMTRSYRWGYYLGCVAMSGAPVAMLALCSLMFGASVEDYGFLLTIACFFGLHAVCGWFVVQRQRWAWVLGTLASFNVILMMINFAYGRKRWVEFAGISNANTGGQDGEDGYHLLHHATMLEADGKVQAALELYQRIAEQFPDSDAGHDARASIASMKARIG